MSVGSVIANIATKFTTVGTSALLKSLSGIGKAGTAMGKALAGGAVTGAAALAKATAGVTVAAGAKAAAIGAFTKTAADDTLESVQGIRSLAALTGENEAVIDFWRQYAGAVGLAGTDLDQVLSGFTSALKDSKDASSDVGKMFAELGVSSTDASGKVRATSAVFSEFLKKLQGVNSQRRGSILTTVFGEDDALKVAELSKNVARDYGQLNSMLSKSNAEGRLVTPEQIAATKRYQAAILKLGATFTTFKRKLFTALEPLLTRYAAFFEGQLFKNGDAIIQQYFVRPIVAASRLFEKFLGLMDRTENFKVLREAASHTFIVIKQLGELGLKFLGLLSKSFAGEGRTAAEAYGSALDQITVYLRRAYAWIETDGPAAMEWAKEFAAKLWSVAQSAGRVALAVGELFKKLGIAIDEALLSNGIDWRQVLTVDNLVSVARGVLDWFGAFYRDIGRLFSFFTNDPTIFSGGFLETAFARMFLKGYRAAADFVKSLGPVLTAAAAVVISKATEAVKAFFAPVITYLKDGWKQFSDEVNGVGPGLDGMTNKLGFVAAAIYNAILWVEELVSAIHTVFGLEKDAPKGFEWLQKARDTVGALIANFVTVLGAIKDLFAPLDFVLKQFGLWNTGTILIASALTLKVGGAIASLIGLITGPAGLGLAFSGLGPIIGTVGLAVAALGASILGAYELLKPIQKELTNAFDFIPGVKSDNEVNDDVARDARANEADLARRGRKTGDTGSGAVTRAQQILASQDLSKRTGRLDESGFAVDPTLVSRTYTLDPGDEQALALSVASAVKPEALAPVTLIIDGRKAEVSANRSQVANLQSVFTGRLG